MTEKIIGEYPARQKVRYECINGYIIAEDGEYQIGEYIERIGEVQYIVDNDEE